MGEAPAPTPAGAALPPPVAERVVRHGRSRSAGRRAKGPRVIGRLNHVAIAVPDLERAAAVYRDTLGAEVSEPVALPEHGVTTVFVELPNTKLELITPLGDGSPIARFLARNPDGGPSSRLLRGGRHRRGPGPAGGGGRPGPRGR